MSYGCWEKERGTLIEEQRQSKELCLASLSRSDEKGECDTERPMATGQTSYYSGQLRKQWRCPTTARSFKLHY